MSSPPAQARSAHPHAATARDRKRGDAEAVGADVAFIGFLVENFYGSIRGDAVLGPIFADRIADWPAHLERMKQFWRSVLHNSGEFSGNPMAKHLAISGLNLEHFSRWLELFYQTLRNLEGSPAATQMVGERARTIADSLLTGIAMQRDGLPAARAGDALPRVECSPQAQRFSPPITKGRNQ